jgi:hypothetical protein
MAYPVEKAFDSRRLHQYLFLRSLGFAGELFPRQPQLEH